MDLTQRQEEKLAWVKGFVVHLATIDTFLAPGYFLVPMKDPLCVELRLQHKTGRWHGPTMRNLVREAAAENDVYAKRIDVIGKVLKATLMLKNFTPEVDGVPRIVPTHARRRPG
jgi:hypothetical protein